MTKFQELIEASRRLDPDAITESITGLSHDPRFVAVLAILDRAHREYGRAIAGQSLATEHGKLAHCAGSMHACENLLGTLQGVIDQKNKQRRRERPPEEEPA